MGKFKRWLAHIGLIFRARKVARVRINSITIELVLDQLNCIIDVIDGRDLSFDGGQRLDAAIYALRRYGIDYVR